VKIAILVYNAFRNDARVEKTARAYGEAGHDVRIVALADDKPLSPAQPAVLRVALRKNYIFREPGSLAWSIERHLLSRLRFGRAMLAGSVLWWRWKQRVPQSRTAGTRGGALSLLRFAERIRGYQIFARHALRALEDGRFRPDLVHANDFNTLLAAELLHDRLGTTFVYDSHELWSGRNRADTAVHPIEPVWELETERRIARKAKAIATVSASIARHLSEVLGVPLPVVIRNVPYASQPHPGGRGLRRVLGVSSHAKLLVYTGKATYNRGLEELVEALARLPGEFHLLILGNFDARFRTLFDARIDQLGLGARVHHYGPVPSEEVASWAAEGDLCLVPIKGACLSYEYCLPNKLFEGIQAGLPILATDLVEMRRTLEEYECGTTFQSGDVADLRQKILDILTAPGVSERLRSKSVEAARHLNWEREKQRLTALVATQSPPSGGARAAEADR
jgi:glycosyltransferase involved in cell wall biosynthesis